MKRGGSLFIKRRPAVKRITKISLPAFPIHDSSAQIQEQSNCAAVCCPNSFGAQLSCCLFHRDAIAFGANRRTPYELLLLLYADTLWPRQIEGHKGFNPKRIAAAGSCSKPNLERTIC